MSDLNIEVVGGASVRLLTEGKYCDKNIVVTAESTEQAIPVISVDGNGLITATAGTKSATQQLTTQGAKTVTPSTSDQTAVASSVYTTGAVTVKGDANLLPENIAEGVSIFGVLGTLTAGGAEWIEATPGTEYWFMDTDKGGGGFVGVAVKGDIMEISTGVFVSLDLGMYNNDSNQSLGYFGFAVDGTNYFVRFEQTDSDATAYLLIFDSF